MVSLGTEPRPACAGADESTARRIDACCRVDAHRRVVHEVLQVGGEIQSSSKNVVGGVCHCRRCEQQFVPIFVISLSRSRKMDGGAVLNTQMRTTRVQHSLKASMEAMTEATALRIILVSKLIPYCDDNL
jgi:hypothetical protein